MLDVGRVGAADDVLSRHGFPGKPRICDQENPTIDTGVVDGGGE